MNDFNDDITRTVISNDEIRNQIGTIFSDSIILDNNFKILVASENILEATGYSQSELNGKPVSYLSDSPEFLPKLEKKLQPGFFDDDHIKILSKHDGSVSYSISGFYLGLIGEINGLIVLKFKNLDEIKAMQSKLEAKTTELDHFIYYSAHALRGPLATIKGLINLAKASTSPEEMEFLIKQMDIFADRLDDKLHRLIYLAESDADEQLPLGEMTLDSIYKVLSAEIEKASMDYPVLFLCPSLTKALVLQRGEAIQAMLKNLIVFFCQQPKQPRNHITLEVFEGAYSTELIIRVKGFNVDSDITEKLINTNYGYSETLNHPEMINCYAAKKIISKLKGTMQFVLTSTDEVVIVMVVPNNA